MSIKPVEEKPTKNGFDLDEVKFDLSDSTISTSDSDSNDVTTYKQTGFQKWINMLLCRGDLADETVEAPPVSFSQLVKNYFYPIDFIKFSFSLSMAQKQTNYW